MHWIEEIAGIDPALTFMSAHLTLLADERARRGWTYMPLGAEPERESYFETPARTHMTRADFFEPQGDGAAAFIAALRSLWEREGHAELLSLLPALEQLTRDLQALGQAPQESEPQAFTYVLF